MAIYLDYAAATPVDDSVIRAMEPYLARDFYNPSALYGPAVDVANDISAARKEIAHLLGAKSTEVIFTAGGTEANNLALSGIMQHFPDARLIISAIEHESVRAPANRYNAMEAAVSKDGITSPEEIAKRVNDETVLVSVMYANNEVGTIQPIRQIARVLSVIRADRQKRGITLPLYLHTDAAQAGNYLDLHVHRLGVDLMTINGGKLYGPKQTGALFVRSGVHLVPQIIGGGQENDLRSGTENVAGIIGLAAAINKSTLLRSEEAERIRKLQDKFVELIHNKIPEARINGSLKNRLPNNLHVTMPGTDNEAVLMALDIEGVYAAAGSACSASSEEPSHVLSAMGVEIKDIRSSIRFSMGRQTKSRDIDHVVEILCRVLA